MPDKKDKRQRVEKMFKVKKVEEKYEWILL